MGSQNPEPNDLMSRSFRARPGDGSGDPETNSAMTGFWRLRETRAVWLPAPYTQMPSSKLVADGPYTRTRSSKLVADERGTTVSTCRRDLFRARPESVVLTLCFKAKMTPQQAVIPGHEAPPFSPEFHPR